MFAEAGRGLTEVLAPRRHGVQPHGKEIRIQRVETLRALCGLDAPRSGTA